MGTQSILLFKEKPSDIYREIRSSGFQSGKLILFLRLRRRNRLSRARSWKNRATNTPYTFTHSDSKPKIFRTSYSADTNVLKQENAWER